MATDKPQSSEAEIRAGLGDALDKFEVFHNQVLLGIYMRGTVKDLGNGKKLYTTDKRADEDKWQGNTGVVLKKGPMAFKNDARNNFEGQDVQVGEWIVFRVSDGFSIDINEVHCRLIEDIHLKARVAAPDITW